MTTSSNENDMIERREERRRRQERLDQLWKEFEEAREAAERSLIRLEVEEELARERRRRPWFARAPFTGG